MVTRGLARPVTRPLTRGLTQRVGVSLGGLPSQLNIGTPLHAYIPAVADGIFFTGTGADDDPISDIVDLVGSIDLSQATGAQQPLIKTVSGRRVAAFTHAHTMVAEALDDLDDASGFTVIAVASVLTRTGTPATTDAIWDIRNAGATEISRLEAGNTSTFLSGYNDTGTGFPDLAATSGDLVDQGFQLFAKEFDGAGDTVTAWLNNQVRATAGSATGVHDSDVDLTVGSNLSMYLDALLIYQGTLTAAQHAAIAAYFGSVAGVSTISGQWGSRNTAVPTFTGTENVGQTLSGSAGTWVNARNASNSLSYQWYNNTDDGNATGTGNATINYTLAAADEGDTVKVIETNTVLGTAYTAESANTGTITNAVTVAYIGNGTFDPPNNTSDPATHDYTVNLGATAVSRNILMLQKVGSNVAAGADIYDSVLDPAGDNVSANRVVNQFGSFYDQIIEEVLSDLSGSQTMRHSWDGTATANPNTYNYELIELSGGYTITPGTPVTGNFFGTPTQNIPGCVLAAGEIGIFFQFIQNNNSGLAPSISRDDAEAISILNTPATAGAAALVAWTNAPGSFDIDTDWNGASSCSNGYIFVPLALS